MQETPTLLADRYEEQGYIDVSLDEEEELNLVIAALRAYKPPEAA
jgi:hypothetical protein